MRLSRCKYPLQLAVTLVSLFLQMSVVTERFVTERDRERGTGTNLPVDVETAWW